MYQGSVFAKHVWKLTKLSKKCRTTYTFLYKITKFCQAFFPSAICRTHFTTTEFSPLLAHVMAWALFGVKSLPNQTMKLFCINHKDNKMWKLSFICKIFRCNTTTTSKCIIFDTHYMQITHQTKKHHTLWYENPSSQVASPPSISIIPHLCISHNILCKFMNLCLRFWCQWVP